MNIILFGPPGSGKGTQADKLVENLNLYKVSTGDLLRDEINNKTVLGGKIKILIDKGHFVSDEIINDLIINIISNKKLSNCLIFDGYPRNINQAKNLDEMLIKYKQKITCVLSLRVENDILLKRLGHREYGDLIIIKIQKVLRANEKNEISSVDRYFPKTITIPVKKSE